MSARSSSGSWGGRECAADIIDLDRYMRGSVRPQHRHRAIDPDCDRLVVDAGGPPVSGGLPVGIPLGGPVLDPTPRPKSSSTAASAPRDKRYSHDSGLSDGSYVRRRTHRRMIGDKCDNTTIRAHRDRERGREHNSSNSMRTFRAACERALRDQQEQIARVAQLCERLTEQTERGGGAAAARQPSVSCTQDSSDISSSSISRSTRDKARKDKHRSNECKTYKIIMNKLDELNRLFAARARSTPPPRRTAAPPLRRSVAPPPPRASSGASVSVSDKLVCTESQLTDRQLRNRPPKSQTPYSITAEVRPVLISPRSPQSTCHSVIRKPPKLVERGVGGDRSGRSAISRLAAARAHELDISPADAIPRSPPAKTKSGRLNVATESVVECDSDATESMIKTTYCKFDLDNPMHLYHQAKRLHHKTRAHSLDCNDSRKRPDERSHKHAHNVSLCARCHSYWRTFTSLASQLFYKSDTEKSEDTCN